MVKATIGKTTIEGTPEEVAYILNGLLTAQEEGTSVEVIHEAAPETEARIKAAKPRYKTLGEAAGLAKPRWKRRRGIYNHGQASVMATCSDCQKVQRKKGQADLKHKETKPENACKKKNPNMSRIQSWHRVYRITKLGEKLMNKTKPENAYERPKRHNTYLRSREYSKQKVLRNKERYHVMVAKYPLKETKPEKKVKP